MYVYVCACVCAYVCVRMCVCVGVREPLTEAKERGGGIKEVRSTESVKI